MGANFCGCCSRKTTHRAKNSGTEHEAMLAASSVAPEPKQYTNGAPAEKVYGAMNEDDDVSYAPLNLDKHSDCCKHHQISHHPVVTGVSQPQQTAKGANQNNGHDQKDLEEVDCKIPATQTNLIISNAGFGAINGDYRWFLHSQKWCLFREDDAFCMERGVAAQNVYDQLQRLQSKEANFRWSDDVTRCWVLSTLDGSNIYYAAPQTDGEFIPNQKRDWISVHGSYPSPEIFPNLVEDSQPPDMDDEFGNASPKPVTPPSHKKAASSQSSLPSITESDAHLEQDMENGNGDQKEQIADEEEEEESMSELEE